MKVVVEGRELMKSDSIAIVRQKIAEVQTPIVPSHFETRQLT